MANFLDQDSDQDMSNWVSIVYPGPTLTLSLSLQLSDN